MNDRDNKILQIGFEAGKKAIEIHPDDNSYDIVRINEAKSVVEEMDSLKEKEYLICSGCEKKLPTVRRDCFDGMCADCTDISFDDDDFAYAAKKRNKELNN